MNFAQIKELVLPLRTLVGFKWRKQNLYHRNIAETSMQYKIKKEDRTVYEQSTKGIRMTLKVC